MNSAAMNFVAQSALMSSFWRTHVFIWRGEYTYKWNCGSHNNSLINCLRNWKLFSKQFYIPTSSIEQQFLHILSVFVTICLFYCSYSSEYEVVSYCDCDLYSPQVRDGKYLSICILAFEYLLTETSIQILGLF